MILGCIGDDFTGSSDLANTLAKGGMRVVQYAGVPDGSAAPGVEAGVVALKSRTIAPAEAVRLSLEALDWLLAQGCRQILFKVCSTFDSTPDGNIGPVADALMERLGAAGPVPVCPAFPAAGRSVYGGHLFVGTTLLSESGMRHHPLTPMSDPDLRRWLGRQTRHGVGHVAVQAVFEGAEAIGQALQAEAEVGRPLVVVDAIRDADLVAIGEASAALPLLVGGSGIALGLPKTFRRNGLLAVGGDALPWTGAGEAPAAILSGSCSVMTRAQIGRHKSDGGPALEVSAAEVVEDPSGAVARAVDFVAHHPSRAGAGAGAPLVSTSADPDVVAAAQARFGLEQSAGAVEAFFAELARQLVAGGVQRLVTAGGETSGAVVEGLGLRSLAIGPEIAAGVPAVRADDRPLWLALKSGNFGDEAFFAKALGVLAGRTP